MICHARRKQAPLNECHAQVKTRDTHVAIAHQPIRSRRGDAAAAVRLLSRTGKAVPGASFSSVPPWMYYLALIVLWPMAPLVVPDAIATPFRVAGLPCTPLSLDLAATVLICCLTTFAWLFFIIVDTAGRFRAKTFWRPGRAQNLIILPLSTWLLGPAWLVLVLIAHIKAVWATEITDNFVTLTGVHPHFTEAYLAEHTPMKRENIISRNDTGRQSAQQRRARSSS